jgi:hypothetical protein
MISGVWNFLSARRVRRSLTTSFRVLCVRHILGGLADFLTLTNSCLRRIDVFIALTFMSG